MAGGPHGVYRAQYRLALAATGEYTAFHGGTKALALAAMTTTINRVNGIFEKDVAVRMVLVANTDLLIYTDGATDPYTNNSGSAMLPQNQTNTDLLIGPANYDVGHVFSTGGGGLATVGSPCDATVKARGVTGRSAPVGDTFDVDFVAHELGHQFGANHSYNGTTTGCSTRHAATAFEPGSGSTIMGYAGLCGAENLQPNSDPYFHAGSLDEMIAYIHGEGYECSVDTNLTNSIPTVDAGPDVTIPAFTPFVLSAIGEDADNDPLVYTWEQIDLGAAAPPNYDDGTRPIFRSFVGGDPSRFFPRYADVVANTPVFGEAIPITSRTLTFRVTVRDNKAGGGGINSDTRTVTTTTAFGVFGLTAPNTALTWAAGSQQTITWDVAGTYLAPISCTNVEIRLSTNGGNTFQTLLVAASPNVGSRSIIVPNLGTTQARVKIACNANLFYDLSAVDFTITAGTFAPGDANLDGIVNVSDVFFLINYLFAGGQNPPGDGNVNNDGGTNVADVFYLINYLFAGGPAPL
jgi:hypothetical protein